jgi:hypothetical protein
MSDRTEYTNVGNEGRLRAKATVYDHQGNVVETDHLKVTVPAGGRAVLTHTGVGGLEEGAEEDTGDE